MIAFSITATIRTQEIVMARQCFGDNLEYWLQHQVSPDQVAELEARLIDSVLGLPANLIRGHIPARVGNTTACLILINYQA